MYTSSALISRPSHLGTGLPRATNDSDGDESNCTHQFVQDRSSQPNSPHHAPALIRYHVVSTSAPTIRSPLSPYSLYPRPCPHTGEDLVTLFPTFPPPPSSEENFDLLSSLPPEIAIKILLYLLPVDLCQAVQVCMRWHELAYYSPLELRRKKFIDEKRLEYQKSKENYAPSNAGGRTSFSPSAMTVSPGGPLNAIQPLNLPSPQLSSPTRFTWTDSGNSLTQQRQYQPSSPTYFLVEDVNRLSLDDKHHELQRSLFGSDGSFLLPVGSRKGTPSNLSTLRHTIKEVVGKKVNKSRLRRL